MKLFFTNKAIVKLEELGCFHNICLTSSYEIDQAEYHGFDSIVLRTNEQESAFDQYDQVLETHIGTIHTTAGAIRLLGEDNRIDFDDFHQVFVFLREGQMVDDNVYLENMAAARQA